MKKIIVIIGGRSNTSDITKKYLKNITQEFFVWDCLDPNKEFVKHEKEEEYIFIYSGEPQDTIFAKKWCTKYHMKFNQIDNGINFFLLKSNIENILEEAETQDRKTA